MDYNKDEIMKKLRPTVNGLREILQRLLVNGNFTLRKQIQDRRRISNQEWDAEISAAVDMFHDMVADNVIILKMLEQHPDLKADFEALRKEIVDEIQAEIQAAAEKRKEKPDIVIPRRPGLILPGAQSRGPIQIHKK